MKLIRFAAGDTPPRFGVVIGDRAVAFTSLQQRSGITQPEVATARAISPACRKASRRTQTAGLGRSPSERTARQRKAQARGGAPARTGRGRGAVRLRSHATASQELGRGHREVREGQSADVGVVAGVRQGDHGSKTQAPRRSARAAVLLQVQHEHHRRRRVAVPWPVYTSRLDVEPELVVVYGNPKQPVAGYCIFNDVSARDIQATEFVGGFCLTKDMANGNQLGPYLVTPMRLAIPISSR